MSWTVILREDGKDAVTLHVELLVDVVVPATGSLRSSVGLSSLYLYLALCYRLRGANGTTEQFRTDGSILAKEPHTVH